MKIKQRIAQGLMIAALLDAGAVLAKPQKAKPPAAPASTKPTREDLLHVPPDRGHAQPGQPPAIAPQQFVQGLYTRLNAMSKASPTLDALHGKIGEELRTVVDYPEMARLALGQKWTELTEAQRKEFLTYLTGMVLNTYVKRFKPGQAIEIRYGAAPKNLTEDRVQIASTITVGKTSAEVNYALRPNEGKWWVYDIVVDDASQLQTYRQSFRKILDKEGWPGLMTRMKKAAEKKV